MSEAAVEPVRITADAEALELLEYAGLDEDELAFIEAVWSTVDGRQVGHVTVEATRTHLDLNPSGLSADIFAA